MRAGVLAIAVLAATAVSAFAIPYIPPPQAIYEAPIDRALQNVQAMEGIDPTQRELALGRLNLLAYARDDGPFTYIAEDNRLDEAGSVLCSEVRPSRYEPQPPGTPDQFGPNDRCAAFDFQLGPRIETPTSAPATPSARALARLNAA
ncbi:MAG: hypothetical protein IT547_11885, partial [Hyphomonadaceae bacterium]|nr:hypothetical protein [Hyphomonadaceae bacterium]